METEPLTNSVEYEPPKHRSRALSDAGRAFDDLLPENNNLQYRHESRLRNDQPHRASHVKFLSVEDVSKSGGSGLWYARPHLLADSFYRDTVDRMRHFSQRHFPAASPTDENPERGTWSNQIEFFLSCLGYAVGLGSVWRFPYLCFINGGGAFLLPYTIMLFTCAIPVLFLELSIGQFASEGPITVWKISPLFKGVGIGMVMISAFLATYYNVITGWAFYYFFSSLRDQLPWHCCDPQWASENCIAFAADCPEAANSSARFQASLQQENSSDTSSKNSSLKFSADEYFHNVALNLSPSIENLGEVQWHMVAALFVAWTVVFMVLMRGIKSFGKAVYFTSIFPYPVLLILFIRAMLEPGALNGLYFYLKPQWHMLKTAKVWGDALTQIFFATSICTGGVITLASYNRFHNNCYRDAMIIAVGNYLTSIFSGFVVFAILGFMAHKAGVDIEDVVTAGPGLTFIIYPQAVTLLPFAPLWSGLFFFMLVILALSSMFPTVECITTALIDQFADLLRPFKFWVTLGTCLILYSVGVLMCTQGGMYVLNLVDKYAVAWALVIIGLFEIVVFAWRYGAGRVLRDIETMIGFRPNVFWKYTWIVVCPILLVFNLVFGWIDYTPLEYNGEFYPAWSNAVGWTLTFTSFAPIPLYALWYAIQDRKNGLKKPLTGLKAMWREFLALSAPMTNWGPPKLRHKPLSTIIEAPEYDIGNGDAENGKVYQGFATQKV